MSRLPLALLLLLATPLAAQTGSYSPADPIWGIYATGNGYPVFSPDLIARAEYEGISPECLKTLTIAVMPGALVAPDSPATYWLAVNLGAGLVEIKEEGLTWNGAQEALNLYSPYRNPAIDCVGSGALSLGGATFSTTYGTMTFSSDESATYGGEDGIITAARNGLVLEGIWVEESSARECESARGGSTYWGRIRFEFDAELQYFSGTWGYCDDEPSRSWTGTRE